MGRTRREEGCGVLEISNKKLSNNLKEEVETGVNKETERRFGVGTIHVPNKKDKNKF